MLRLFNAVWVETKEEYQVPAKLIKRMVSNGYVLDNRINPTVSLLNTIDKIVGIGGEKLNQSFHKSWKKVANSSDVQLLVEQIAHYITTYGFEALGIYNESLVYIPYEELDIPTIKDSVPLISIRAFETFDVLESLPSLTHSGIALSQTTLEDIMVVVKELDLNLHVESVKNRELKMLLYDHYNMAPTEPVDFLRYVILKLTGETLIIKNDYLIEKIKSVNGHDLDNLLELAPANLASIFFRFKPLFLAMKSVSFNPTFFNRLRKHADRIHEPLAVDYLSTVTAQIESGVLNFKDFRKMLKHYPVWRKIRLLTGINNRLSGSSSIVYKIRNGRGWVENFTPSSNASDLFLAAEAVVESVAESVNVRGKTFYIPSHIHYALPQSEKQFVGNVPANSYVKTDKDLVVGIHWYNVNGHRIDIDLSLVGLSEKFGWDASYRSSDRNILFSGDVTNAPNGATELFYINQSISDAMLINANYFNYMEEVPVDCQLVVASQKVSEFKKNYVINPNNMLASLPLTITQKQTVIGIVAVVGEETRVYLSPSSIGKSISSRSDDRSAMINEFYMKTMIHTTTLDEVLVTAGANVVSKKVDGCIDLSPEALDKNTIIGLFHQ